MVSLQDYGDSQPDNKQLKRKRDVKAEEKASRGRPIEKYDDFLREKRLTIKNLEGQIADKEARLEELERSDPKYEEIKCELQKLRN